MVKTLKPVKLIKGDTIGIVAPSRPILLIKKEVDRGIMNLRKLGYKIKLGKNLEKRLYYSAGTPKAKADDINSMFRDEAVKAIICATGGSSSNQVLGRLDFGLITKNPKIFLGYSDITTLLLAINAKTGLVTFHGPSVYELSHLKSRTFNFLFELVSEKRNNYIFPREMEVIKPGKSEGKLIGGNIMVFNSLLGSEYCALPKSPIFFWEEIGESPAMIDFRLNELKNRGFFKKISAMVVGHLSKYKDKKYPEDNRPVKEILLETTKEYKFPIIKVDYFGHDILSFYAFPIGIKASIDTEKKEFKLIETSIK